MNALISPDLLNFREVGSSHTEMNGMNFPWAAETTSHVAPRQLGYKSVKFTTQLTVTDSLKGFGKGLGTALYLSARLPLRNSHKQHAQRSSTTEKQWQNLAGCEKFWPPAADL